LCTLLSSSLGFQSCCPAQFSSARLCDPNFQQNEISKSSQCSLWIPRWEDANLYSSIADTLLSPNPLFLRTRLRWDWETGVRSLMSDRCLS
jgi:hypothetical protein